MNQVGQDRNRLYNASYMKALILLESGTVPRLEVVDLPIPTPGTGEVLIKVESCGFCYHDYLVMLGLLRRGVKDDVVLGHEISGTIASVGDKVTDVSVGDRVVTLLTNACGTCTIQTPMFQSIPTAFAGTAGVGMKSDDPITY